MTSAQTMLASPRAIGALLACFVLASGCSSGGRHTPPNVLVAPYDSVRGEVLWAMVPLRNESGTTSVDTESLSDEVIAAAEQTRGVACLPLNRTITAMRVLGIMNLTTPEEAQRLAGHLGVDGLIVGSVTAYDPYTPVLGLSLALHARPGPMLSEAQRELDARWLTQQPTEHASFTPIPLVSAPASVVSIHLDADNHQTLIDLQNYAQGRHNPDSPFGWRRYAASMALFTKFAAHRAVDQLLRKEWLRFARGRDRGLGNRG